MKKKHTKLQSSPVDIASLGTNCKVAINLTQQTKFRLWELKNRRRLNTSGQWSIQNNLDVFNFCLLGDGSFYCTHTHTTELARTTTANLEIFL